MSTDQATTGTTRFSLEAGALVRGQVRRALEKARFQLEGEGGGLELREAKGWLASDFYVTARGPAWLLEQLVGWARGLDDEEGGR